jgi:hypothetical protein
MSRSLYVVVEVQDAEGTWHAVPPRAEPCSWCHGTGGEVASAPVSPDDRPGTRPASTAPDERRRCRWCAGGGTIYVGPYLHHSAWQWIIACGAGRAGQEPRGLPADLSAELRQGAVDEPWPQVERSRADPRNCYQIPVGAECSWVLLEEILEYDWGQTVERYGYVEVATFQHWEQTGELLEAPRERLADDEIYLPPDAARRRLRDGSADQDPAGRSYVTHAPCGETHREQAVHFLALVETELWSIGAPDRVRLVAGIY